MRSRSIPSAARAGVTATVAALAVSACGIFGLSDRPEEVRVQVDGQGLDGPVTIVTSKNFFFGITEEGFDAGIQVVSADTVTAEAPFDETFAMAPNYMFLVRARRPTEQQGDPTMSLRVLVDGSEAFNQSQVMQEGSMLEYYVIHR